MSEDKLTWTGVMMRLSDLGIKNVYISYNGSGDSGNIETVYGIKSDDPDDENRDLLQDIDLDDHSDLKNFIEEKMYDECLNHIENWYNNEGGDGHIYIKVPEGTWKCENNINIVTQETYHHTGEIEDKEN